MPHQILLVMTCLSYLYFCGHQAQAAAVNHVSIRQLGIKTNESLPIFELATDLPELEDISSNATRFATSNVTSTDITKSLQNNGRLRWQSRNWAYTADKDDYGDLQSIADNFTAQRMLRRLISFCQKADDHSSGREFSATYTMILQEVKIQLELLVWPSGGGLPWTVDRATQFIVDFYETSYTWIGWHQRFSPIVIEGDRIGDLRKEFDGRSVSLSALPIAESDLTDLDLHITTTEDLRFVVANDEAIDAGDAVGAIQECVQAVHDAGGIPPGDQEITCSKGAAVFRLESQMENPRDSTVSASKVQEVMDTVQEYIKDQKRGRWAGFYGTMTLGLSPEKIELTVSMGIAEFGRGGLRGAVGNITELS